MRKKSKKLKMEEVEVKFLNIEPKEIEKKLILIGAKKVFDRIYKRKVFDYPDLRLDKVGAWIRLRDEGDKITLAFKKRLGVKTHNGKTCDRGMEEIEIQVDDFDKTASLLKSIGLIEKFYEENRRIRYVKEDVEFDIDFWPLLEPYLEIEAKNWKQIDKAIKLLGLNPKEKKIFSTYQIYQLKGIDENDFKVLTFDKVIKK
jgi:adenylate cyclase class 2